MIFGLAHPIQGGRAHPLALTFNYCLKDKNQPLTTMLRRALPIGIQTFRQIREGDYYYVDKTGFALRLIDEGKY